MNPSAPIDQPVPSPSAFSIGLAVACWLFLGVLIGVPLGPRSEASRPITSWLLTGAASGAVAHALLLLSGQFRRLQMARISVVWCAAMLLLLAARLAMRTLEPVTLAHESLAIGGAWMAVPMFAASATANWIVERAEA